MEEKPCGYFVYVVTIAFSEDFLEKPHTIDAHIHKMFIVVIT